MTRPAAGCPWTCTFKRVVTLFESLALRFRCNSDGAEGLHAGGGGKTLQGGALRHTPSREDRQGLLVVVRPVLLFARSKKVLDVDIAGGRAGQVGQARVHEARVKNLVASVHLGVSLFDEGQPPLVDVLVPRKSRHVAIHGGDQSVDCNVPPLAILEELDADQALVEKPRLDEELRHQIRLPAAAHDAQSREEVAVAEIRALDDVVCLCAAEARLVVFVIVEGRGVSTSGELMRPLPMRLRTIGPPPHRVSSRTLPPGAAGRMAARAQQATHPAHSPWADS